MSEFEPQFASRLDIDVHGRFIRSIAASLLGDEESADLTQDALLAVLESSSIGEVPEPAKQAWLGRVVQRMAFKRLRGDQARKRREKIHAEGQQSVSTPESSLMRNETVKVVSAAVDSLREPYLSTILMRFYLDQDAHQIAEIMGASVATVRSRLQRAKALLRESLEAEFGGSERDMRLALLPFVSEKLTRGVLRSGAAGTAGLTKWGLLANAMFGLKSKVALVVLCALGGWSWQTRAHEQPKPESPGAGSGLVARSPLVSDLLVDSHAPANRSEVKGELFGNPDRPSGTSPDLGRPTTGLVGRVVYEGNPVAGVKVQAKGVRVCRLIEAQTNRFVAGTDSSRAARAILKSSKGYPAIPIEVADAGLDGPLPELYVDSHSLGWSTVETDTEGRFRFAEIPSREFLLEFRDGTRGLGLRSSVQLLVESEILREMGDLELFPLATVSGSICSKHAHSLGGHQVQMNGSLNPICTTSATGGFHFDGVLPGEYRVNMRAGVGLYLTEKINNYFVRLLPGENREMKLRVPSARSCVLSVEVKHNTEPFSEGVVVFTTRGGRREVKVTLDKGGQGLVTLPAAADLQCLAYLGKYVLSLGEDLFLAEGEASASFSIETGGLRVELPSKVVPQPDVCHLTFHTDFPEATNVRFGTGSSELSREAELDASGTATLTLPAGVRLQPAIQLRDEFWIQFSSKVPLPAGEAAFEVDWDPVYEKVIFSGLKSQAPPGGRASANLYALELRWPAASSDEVHSLRQTLNPLNLDQIKESRLSFDFPHVPTGLRKFELVLLVLERSDKSWTAMKSFQQTLDIRADNTTAFMVLD